MALPERRGYPLSEIIIAMTAIDDVEYGRNLKGLYYFIYQ